MAYRILTILALGACLLPVAHADHHGRGKEQLNGFPGVWDVPGGRATFTDDGYLVMASMSSRVAIAVLRYSIQDDVMTLQDVSPPAFLPAEARECGREQSGQYRMVWEDHAFQLEVIEEPCKARAGLFTRAAMTPYVRPEPEPDENEAAGE